MAGRTPWARSPRIFPTSSSCSPPVRESRSLSRLDCMTDALLLSATDKPVTLNMGMRMPSWVRRCCHDGCLCRCAHAAASGSYSTTSRRWTRPRATRTTALRSLASSCSLSSRRRYVAEPAPLALWTISSTSNAVFRWRAASRSTAWSWAVSARALRCRCSRASRSRRRWLVCWCSLATSPSRRYGYSGPSLASRPPLTH